MRIDESWENDLHFRIEDFARWRADAIAERDNTAAGYPYVRISFSLPWDDDTTATNDKVEHYTCTGIDVPPEEGGVLLGVRIQGDAAASLSCPIRAATRHR